MNRVLLPLLLGFLSIACGGKSEPAVFEVAPGNYKKVDKASSLDPIVKVSGPSTILVAQNKRVRITIEWPHTTTGYVALPLAAVDDGSEEPLFISVRAGLLGPEVNDSLYSLMCANCLRPDRFAPCCPR